MVSQSLIECESEGVRDQDVGVWCQCDVCSIKRELNQEVDSSSVCAGQFERCLREARGINAFGECEFNRIIALDI